MVLFKGDRHLTVPVELHVKPVFLALSRGGDRSSPVSGAAPERGWGRPRRSPVHPQASLCIEESENKVFFEANVTILSSMRSKIKEALKT